MAGIYVHIPFCKKRCAYCDFFSTTSLHLQQSYVEAVIAEIQCRQQEFAYYFSNEKFQTLYFGGGTPSLLPSDKLSSIFKVLHLPLSNMEITVEVNPDDITPQYCSQLKEIGVNRISMGVQSFSETALKVLNRRHTVKEAINAINTIVQSGLNNLSIDLMYGLPHQTLHDWEKEIKTAIRLPITHLSTYCLTLEPHTQLYRIYQNRQWKETNDDLLNAMYDLACDELYNAGFQHYEISNFSLHGCCSVHNTNYWNGTPYIGLGAAAHSFNGKVRSWNIANMNAYLQQAKEKNFIREEEHLTIEQANMEKIMLGLRTQHGVEEKYISDKRHLAHFIADGFLFKNGNNVVATRSGQHILNFIISHLV